MPGSEGGPPQQCGGPTRRFRIQRQRQRGSNKWFVYTWPSRKALTNVMAKVKTIARQGTNQPLAELLRQINAVLRGWTSYFRHGVSKTTFSFLHQYTWERITRWLRRKHRRITWKKLKRRYLPGWWPTDGEMTLFNAGAVPVTRYRYRGTKIPTPWTPAPVATP
ncbi:group II intron maturase-specific domain-containing protein [Micromonospora sp. NPDC050686]|uniref:group II intron maturase-specific domain-containing protein n=1 Tax=Micromonospora sp. NPDC050686 TaxID=3154631 RepID=UPI0033E5BFDD